jgi:UDP-N-acetylglucosamine/UDP-N-acetylgalactosamine diphosphorylase
MDLHGRLLLAGPGQLFLAPNGHGGSLAALADSGALEDMAQRGIETLSYFQVDNPLARPADPLFIGLHSQAAAGMSSKVVAKRDAGEKVGVIGSVDGKLGCIEYSDLSDELRDARDDAGRLVFRAGNIALHVLDVDFIQSLTAGGKLQLPWHIAHKNMNVLAADDRRVDVEGVKFETFVFDALASSPKSVTLEVDRALEFSPVKNKEGQDSAMSCRADLEALFRSMLAGAGLPVPSGRIEIDPRLAEDATELAARAQAGEVRTVELQSGTLYELSS